MSGIIRPRSVSLPSWLCSDAGAGEREVGLRKGRVGEKRFELQRVHRQLYTKLKETSHQGYMSFEKNRL